jgi:hypothetical protein
MAVNCDVIVNWGATPVQLAALGAALWRWCNRAPRDNRPFQYLDNQALADLLAGKLPTSAAAPWLSGPRGVSFRVRDAAWRDRQATLDSLRRALPAEALQDIVVDGTRWNAIASALSPGRGSAKT